MSDITPKEAIANLNHLYGMVAPDIQRSLDVAIKALERPSGDCISREALKDITYINKGNFNTVEGIREWIDNAQTIEHSLLPLSSEADNAYMRGYEVGKAEGILKASTRPKGDLISREALRKAFENLASDDYNEPIWYQQTVFETIDNAQAVPQVTVFAENADEKAIEDMKAELQNVIEARPNEQIAWEQGYEAGLAQGKQDRTKDVVFCKDCIHTSTWRSEASARKYGQERECLIGVLNCPKGYDFCSRGESRLKKGGAE